MNNEVIEYGRIQENGSLKVPPERLREFFAQHKGAKVLVRIEAIGESMTSAQWGYYYGYIVPTIRQALYSLGERKTDAEVDEWLVAHYPFTDQAKASDIKKEMLTDFLEWLKEFAAENLGVFIEDPKTL